MIPETIVIFIDVFPLYPERNSEFSFAIFVMEYNRAVGDFPQNEWVFSFSQSTTAYAHQSDSPNQEDTTDT